MRTERKMAMKKRLLIIMMFVGGILSCANAQNTNKEPILLKNLRHAAYEWVREYSLAKSFRGRSAQKKYISLFVDENAKVVHDYLPAKDYPFEDTQITAQEYAILMTNENNLHTIFSTISDVEIVSVNTRTNGSFIIILQWRETISYSPKDFHFDLLYPDFDFRLRCILDYNPHNKETKAERIELDQHPMQPFVILHTENSNELTTKNEIIHLAKSHNTALVRNNVIQSEIDEKFYTISTDTLTNNSGLNMAYGVGKLSIAFANSVRYSDFTSSVSDMTVVWNYYRQLKLLDKHRLGVEAGIGWTSGMYRYGFSYSERFPDVDPDGSDYERRVEVNGYSEQMQWSTISIPISLRYDYHINPIRFAVFGRVGLLPSLALKHDITGVAAHTQIAGYYSELFGVVMDENGFYDFGAYSSKQFDGPAISFGDPMLEAIIEAGFTWFWVEKNLSAELSAEYRPLLIQPIAPIDDYHLLPTMRQWEAAEGDIKAIQHKLFNIHLQINYHF